jgi:hypothetical protein
MRHTILLVATFVGFAAAQDAEQQLEKSAGVITSKTEYKTGQQWVDFHTAEGNGYVCYLKNPHPHFVYFRAGDQIEITGHRKPQNNVFHECVIETWKSTGTTPAQNR